MKKLGILITAAVFLSFYSCKDDETDQITDPVGDEPIEVSYDFESGIDGWDTGIAGYLAAEEDIYGFEAEQTTAPFDENEGVLKLSASNPNDNLFMYASRQITGLEPNTNYEVDVAVSFASDVVIDTTGVAGDTTGVATDSTDTGTDTTGNLVVGNDTIVVKAGVVTEEPVIEPDETDVLQLVGIDIGETGADGADLVVIGTYPGNGAENDYPVQTAAADSPFTVTSNEDGELWLIVATESSGTRTEVYINNIDVVISQD